jgi:hypothetical protein
MVDMFTSAIPGVEALPVDRRDYEAYGSQAEAGSKLKSWTIELSFHYVDVGVEVLDRVLVLSAHPEIYDLPYDVKLKKYYAGYAWAAAKAASSYWVEPARVVREKGGSIQTLPPLVIVVRAATDRVYADTGEWVTVDTSYGCEPEVVVEIATGRAGPETFLAECLDD